MPRNKSVRNSEKLAGKLVSASRTEMTEVVLPQDANVFGNILGGRVMHLVDIAAAITAHRHCRSMAVTASVDHIDFRNPIRVGEVITLKASLNRSFHTSMEIGVKVFSEDILTGEKKHTTSAYVTFVALDEEHRPKPVPPVILPGGGVADPAGRSGFFPNTTGGIDALDLASGKLLWQSKDGQGPLLATADRSERGMRHRGASALLTRTSVPAEADRRTGRT